jgi:ferredoxin/flavodoxin---NADP+ reductase
VLWFRQNDDQYLFSLHRPPLGVILFRIVRAVSLATGIKRFTIEAPRIARKQQAGQFVIVRVHDRGERIPLTIASADATEGTIDVIVQAVGKTTYEINALEAGDSILDVVGPLGRPSDVRYHGTVVIIGGGVGTAIAYPTAAAMKKAGNKVISILGARTKDLVILEPEVCAVSDATFVVTDDGSYGRKGLVTDQLKQLIQNGTPINLVLAIGPIPMMRAVAELTRGERIPTLVSLNSIMVDGTGMCGGCRVIVNGTSEFACVDGPEFDAHTVDFDVLASRNRMYREQEAESLSAFQRQAAETTEG